MRLGQLTRLWTVHGTFAVSGYPDVTGTIPACGWTVACPSCERAKGLRLVVVAPLAVFWCPCRATWSYPWMHHRAMIDLVTPLCSGPMKEWVYSDGEVPADVLDEFPGLDVLLETIGEVVRASCVQPHGPTQEDLRDLLLARPPNPAMLVEQADLDRAGRAVRAFYRDQQVEGHPDSVVVVPMSLRELAMLQALTATSEVAALPAETVLKRLAHDLYHRATTLASLSPRDVRDTVTQISTATETAMRIGRWIDAATVEAHDSVNPESVESSQER